MNIGDYVTVQEVADQSINRWVVLVDLCTTDDGDIEGGIIRYIEDTKVAAGEKTAQLYAEGTTALLVCGTIEPLSLGGVLVN